MAGTLLTVLGAILVFVLYALITALAVCGTATMYLELTRSYNLGKPGYICCAISAVITPIAVTYIAMRVL